MSIASDTAPEIDRLVWTVHRGVAPKHGARLGELAAEIGLDSLDPFPVTADFLLAAVATIDVICRRMPYRAAEAVTARLDDLEAMGLIDGGGWRLGATDRLRPLLEAIRGCQADIAAANWTGNEGDLDIVAGLARKVGLAASDDHVVAAVHRALPPADDPFLSLYDRLVTLRYIRQHDHVVSWQAHGLTAPEMVTMTALWHGDSVTDDEDGLAALAGRGWASLDPVELTAAGRTVRDEIEAETNRRARLSFDVLDEDEGEALLSGLRALPGSGT